MALPMKSTHLVEVGEQYYKSIDIKPERKPITDYNKNQIKKVKSWR